MSSTVTDTSDKTSRPVRNDAACRGAAPPAGPLPLVIGVTGHRDLRSEDRPVLEAKVRGIFERLTTRYPATPLVLLSPLAEGADRLAARVALESGHRLICPLPMAADVYEADFEMPESRAEFHDLLERAEARFEVTPPANGAASGDSGGGTSRVQRYARAGEYIVRNCQILIAIWDGAPSAKTGGTAEVVRMQLGGILGNIDLLAFRPTDQPETGPVYHIVAPKRSGPDGEKVPGSLRLLVPGPDLASPPGGGRGDPFADADVPPPPMPYDRLYRRMDEFNHDAILLDKQLVSTRRSCLERLMAEEEAGALPADLRSDLECLAIAAALAEHFDRRRDRTLIGLLILTFLAVATFQVGTLSPAELGLGSLWETGGWESAFAILYLAALATGYGLYLWARRMRYDTRFLDCRALAEALRVQFFWRLAGLSDSVADHYLRKQRSEVDWIRNAVRAGRVLEDVEHGGVADRLLDSTAKRLQLVSQRWVAGQERYFRRTADWFCRTKSVLGKVGHGLFLTALALALLNMFQFESGVFGYAVAFSSFSASTVIATLLILAAAGLIGVYTKIKALSEHARRYRQMADVFANARQRLIRLLEVQDFCKARQLLRELGHEALDENGDWLLLHRDRPLDRPLL